MKLRRSLLQVAVIAQSLYSRRFLFQMVQAIQVLRFHLLELEKVSPRPGRRYRSTDRQVRTREAQHIFFVFIKITKPTAHNLLTNHFEGALYHLL
jgi:hypothetical protein